MRIKRRAILYLFPITPRYYVGLDLYLYFRLLCLIWLIYYATKISITCFEIVTPSNCDYGSVVRIATLHVEGPGSFPGVIVVCLIMPSMYV